MPINLLWLLALTTVLSVVALIGWTALRRRRAAGFARQPKVKLGLLAIFKDESVALGEWIEHYLAEGVDLIYLIDNNSTDAFEPIVRPYIASGKVVLFREERKHAQVKAYNDFVLPLKATVDWLIVADLDEFMYCRPRFARTLKAYVQRLPPAVGCVSVRWSMFGSSGHTQQPSSIIDGFVRRQRRLGNESKYIVRTEALTRIGVHAATLELGWKSIVERRQLRLNHYAIQSYEWFMTVKRRRGDVANIKYESVRDADYFKQYDTNGFLDDELKRKRQSRRNHMDALSHAEQSVGRVS